MFSDTEKKVLKEVIKAELARLKKSKSKIMDTSPSEFAVEGKYEEVLEGIAKKLTP